MPTPARLDRRVLDNGVAVLISSRAEADGFLVGFTERSGGVSRGPFRALNLGLRTADDPQRVLANRERVRSALGIQPFALAAQVHGARVERVGPRRGGMGFSDADEAVAGADALVTSSRGLPLAVLVADCVPLALVAPAGGAFAVVHAGWRGIAAGILPAAVSRLGAPDEIHATIGPAIGEDHYEVGDDVARAVSAASEAGARTRRVGGRLLLDLPGTLAQILKELGVKGIDQAAECTACEKERFFSHRRDGPTGRQALIAARL